MRSSLHMLGIAVAAAALASSPPRAAENLAAGRHLWSVSAPDGTQGFIAAVNPSSDPRDLERLPQQLSAAGGVRRLVLDVDGRASPRAAQAPDDPWSRPVAEALPPDLAASVEMELAPALARGNLPASRARTLPLAAARFLLLTSAEQVRPSAGPGEVGPAAQAISAFMRERGQTQTLALKAYTPEEMAKVPDPFGSAPELAPAEAVRRILDDRGRNGPVLARLAARRHAGDWEGERGLWLAFATAVLGWPEAEARARLQGGAFADGRQFAQEASGALRGGVPTLLVVTRTDLLGGPDGLLAELHRSGFAIGPARPGPP